MVALVPNYLHNLDLGSASPGLRFGLFFSAWKADFSIGKDDKVPALKAIGKFNMHKTVMQAIASRQMQLANETANTLTLDAIATAPFTTGLGNEHPLENGFAFLNPYGLPYLPGSGIKGVLRQAARELASGEWGDTHGWAVEKNHQLGISNDKTIALSVIDALFGLESGDGSSEHVRGALCFWDAIPQIQGDSLSVDIMTPHQSHYYQQKTDRKSGASTTPHDSGQPNPISFLTVPPGTRLAFQVQCDLPHLQRIAPTLAEHDHWKTLLAAAFEHAFAWLGFGAKTAVGYGAMQIDAQAAIRRQQEREQAEAAERQRLEAEAEAARLASLSPAMQAIETFIAEFRAKHTQYPAFKDRPNATFHAKARALAKTAHEAADWTADEKRAAAEAIETWLPKLVQIDIKDERKKLKLNALKGL